jgi:hypothetical protein
LVVDKRNKKKNLVLTLGCSQSKLGPSPSPEAEEWFGEELVDLDDDSSLDAELEKLSEKERQALEKEAVKELEEELAQEREEALKLKKKKKKKK